MASLYEAGWRQGSILAASLPITAVVLLAKDPADRYQSAGDLGAAARASAMGEPLPSVERSVASGDAAPTTLTRRATPRQLQAGAAGGVEPARLAPAVRLLAASVLIAAVVVTAVLLLGSFGSKTRTVTVAPPSTTVRTTVTSAPRQQTTSTATGQQTQPGAVPAYLAALTPGNGDSPQTGLAMIGGQSFPHSIRYDFSSIASSSCQDAAG